MLLANCQIFFGVRLLNGDKIPNHFRMLAVEGCDVARV